MSTEIQKEINMALKGHVTDKLLSPQGRRMYFPRGIVAQTEESSKAKIKATSGMATSAGKPITLPVIENVIANFTTQESVAYAPVAGILALREQWLARMLKKNPSLQAENITKPIVTSGITHGVRVSLELMLAEGEEIISCDMFWENYNHIVSTTLGGSIRTFELFTFNTLRDAKPFVNIDGLAKAMEQSAAKQGKIILLLNFPNNPSGYSITQKDMNNIKEAVLFYAQKNVPILILCDDAYFGLFYEDDIFLESPFAVFSALHENILAIKLDGATKELFAWGLRVGFITFGGKNLSVCVKDALENKVKALLRASTTSASKISQSIVLKTITSSSTDYQLQEKFQELKKRYAITKEEIAAAVKQFPNAGLIPYPCNSGYFISLYCTKINSEVIRKHLLEKHDIALIAINEKILRFTFSSVDAVSIPKVIKLLFMETQLLAQ